MATSKQRVTDWNILVNQGRTERSLRDELSYHLVCTNSDTAGEVLEALVRSIGVVKSPPIDVEVPYASSDTHRTCPT